MPLPHSRHISTKYYALISIYFASPTSMISSFIPKRSKNMWSMSAKFSKHFSIMSYMSSWRNASFMYRKSNSSAMSFHLMEYQSRKNALTRSSIGLYLTQSMIFKFSSASQTISDDLSKPTHGWLHRSPIYYVRRIGRIMSSNGPSLHRRPSKNSNYYSPKNLYYAISTRNCLYEFTLIHPVLQSAAFSSNYMTTNGTQLPTGQGNVLL